MYISAQLCRRACPVQIRANTTINCIPQCMERYSYNYDIICYRNLSGEIRPYQLQFINKTNKSYYMYNFKYQIIKLSAISHCGPVVRRLSFIPDQPNLANMHKYGLNFIIPILYFNAY